MACSTRFLKHPWPLAQGWHHAWWAGPSPVSHWPRKSPIDLPTGQVPGGIFSVQVLSSQLILSCAKLAKCRFLFISSLAPSTVMHKLTFSKHLLKEQMGTLTFTWAREEGLRALFLVSLRPKNLVLPSPSFLQLSPSRAQPARAPLSALLAVIKDEEM